MNTNIKSDKDEDKTNSKTAMGDKNKFGRESMHSLSSVDKVVAVVSGKGGVGKSLVTSLLAMQMGERGYKVGILDADITGASIPRMFGVKERLRGDDDGLYPQYSKKEIGIVSANLFIEAEDAPLIWRGPMISGTVKQFWSDVIWHDINYLFIDMPPGTGDVPLTVFQSIQPDGIVIVASPQELVQMIVRKAYHMAARMNVPILGLIENMSYLRCPDCGKEIKLFGNTSIEESAAALGIPFLGRMPIDPVLAERCDSGNIESMGNIYLSEACTSIEKQLAKQMRCS